MNLSTLQKFANYLNQTPPLKLHSIHRIADNLFKFNLGGKLLFMDLSKGKSTIFTTTDNLVASKIYQAPFDISLQKYCFNALIMEAKTDGNNRILQLFLQTKNSYKTSRIVLQAELTGRNTNLILLDTHQVVLDALRHITKEQSFREVRIAKPLLPLPQPTCVPKFKDEGELWSVLENNYCVLKIRELQAKITKSSMQITQKIAQLQHHLEALGDKNILERNAQKEARLGQLILQNLYLYPHFKKRVIVLENEKIIFPAKARSLSHCAQIFFENSKKFAKKAKNIHLQAQNIKEKIAFYQNLLEMIRNVTNLNDLEILDSNLRKKTDTKESKSQLKQFESFFIEGIKVSIGKNERENIALLKAAKAEDIWLHIRGIPSSHCVIHCGKSKISDIILQKAAQILIGFTRNINENYVVDYTKRRFVKITFGANVVYAKAQTIQLKKD